MDTVYTGHLRRERGIHPHLTCFRRWGILPWNWLKDAIQDVCDVLSDIHKRYDIVGDIVSRLMKCSGLHYENGREYHLDQLIAEIEQCRIQLHTEDDYIPSYEESETIFDAGYREEWIDSGVYAKVLEDTEVQEIVEEIILKYEKPIYRKRTTFWEKVSGGRHSKEILYEDLPISDDIARLINNTKRKLSD